MRRLLAVAALASGFVAYTPKNTSLGTANTLSIGARGGVSLWP